MFHVVRLSEWNEPIRRREDNGYFKNKECKSRKTSVTLEVVILFVSLDYMSHDTIHKFARTHMFLKCFFCIYNVLIKSFESCHEKDYSWNCTRIQTTLHVRRVSFRRFSNVKSRFSNRNSYSRSERHLLVLVAPARRRQLYRCKYRVKLFAKRIAEIVIVLDIVIDIISE